MLTRTRILLFSLDKRTMAIMGPKPGYYSMPFRELDTTGDPSTNPSGAAEKITPLPVKHKLGFRANLSVLRALKPHSRQLVAWVQTQGADRIKCVEAKMDHNVQQPADLLGLRYLGKTTRPFIFLGRWY